MRKLMMILMLGLLGQVTCLYAQVADQIHIGKGPAQRGVITKMTATEVTLTINTVARPVQVNTILRISFADAPPGLEMALGQIRGGQ